MLKFIDTTTVTRFESPLDLGETKTVFLIAPLNSQEVQVINDATISIKVVAGKESIDLKQTLRNRLFVQCGLRGWENAGKEFATELRSILGLPKKEIVKEDLLNSIPVDFVNSIGERIAELSVSTGVAEKN